MLLLYFGSSFISPLNLSVTCDIPSPSSIVPSCRRRRRRRHKMKNMARCIVKHKLRTKLSNQQCKECPSSAPSRSPPSNQASPCAPQACSRRRAPSACRTPTAHGRPSLLAPGCAERPCPPDNPDIVLIVNCTCAYARET